MDNVDFLYEIVDDEVFITKYIGKNEVVKVPNLIENKPVTRVKTGTFGYGCTAKKIYLPKGLKQFDKYVNLYCYGVKIYLLEKISEVNKNVLKVLRTKNYAIIFDYENNSKDSNGYEYLVNDGIEYRVKDRVAEVHLCLTNVEKVIIKPEIIFNGNKYITRVIDSNAFWKTNNLTEILLPNTLKRISCCAFVECTGLKRLHLPSSIKLIDDSIICFGNNLEEISIENNKYYHVKDNCLIETATNNLILGCKNSIIPSYVKKICESAFDNVNVKEMFIPKGVENIDNHAFIGCEKTLIKCETDKEKEGWLSSWNLIGLDSENENKPIFCKVEYNCKR